MRRSIPISALLIITLVFLSFNCEPRRKGKESQSPAETIKAVYMAANGGWYSETEKYIYSEVLDSIKKHLGTLTTSF